MHSGGGSHDSTFTVGVYCLIAFGIIGFRLAFNVFWQRSLSEAEQRLFEFIVVSVVKEPESASARGGVVNNFCNHAFVIAEV